MKSRKWCWVANCYLIICSLKEQLLYCETKVSQVVVLMLYAVLITVSLLLASVTVFLIPVLCRILC